MSAFAKEIPDRVPIKTNQDKIKSWKCVMETENKRGEWCKNQMLLLVAFNRSKSENHKIMVSAHFLRRNWFQRVGRFLGFSNRFQL